MNTPTTISAGTTTSPFLVNPDGWIVITPSSGATVTVEYTSGTVSDVSGGGATWTTQGSYTVRTALRVEEDLQSLYFRLTATSASVDYSVEGELSASDRIALRSYAKTIINPVGSAYSLDSSGNVTGLVGPGGLIQGTPRMIAGDSCYQASILNHATSTYDFCGYDTVDSTVFIKDSTGGVLRQGTTSDGWETQGGATFTGNKTLPTSPNAVLYTGIVKIIRFKGKLYLLAKDSVTNLTGIYRTDPTPGATAFTWSTPIKQMTSSTATALYTVLDADASYMYLGEYGDPVGGPTVWRSADGDTWTQIYTEIGGAGGSQRHMHAIAADPYNAGHVWMTLGDANAPREIMRSVDYGTTWTTVAASAKYQGVQISFSPSWVYIAGDSQRGIVMTVRRSDNAIFWAASGSFKNTPVVAPAAVSDSWYYNAWIGVVDPVTGEYYCSANDSSAGGNTPGVFCVPYPGAEPVLIEKPSAIASPIDIAAGFLWFGKYRRKLHGR